MRENGKGLSIPISIPPKCIDDKDMCELISAQANRAIWHTVRYIFK